MVTLTSARAVFTSAKMRKLFRNFFRARTHRIEEDRASVIIHLFNEKFLFNHFFCDVDGLIKEMANSVFGVVLPDCLERSRLGRLPVLQPTATGNQN